MGEGVLLLVAVFAPLAGAFLLPLLGRFSKLVRNYAALVFVLTSLGCSLALVPNALDGHVASFSVAGPLGL